MNNSSSISRLSWSLAWKDIKYSRFFTFFFIVNMGIGLLGLVVIENFKVSFKEVLDGKARELLGADLEISGRFPLSDTQRTKINQYLKSIVKKDLHGNSIIEETHELALFSMARSDNGGRLVSLNSIDVNASHDSVAVYPYYGYWELDHKKKYPLDTRTPPLPGHVWAYPAVIELLGSRSLKLGDREFKVESIVTDDTGQTFDMGPLAPKVYIRSDDLMRTNLIRKGSTVSYYTSYKLGLDRPVNDKDIHNLNNLIDDNAIRVRVPKNSSQQVGRILSYLSDFLGLVSLVALFLSSIGLFYLYRSHLASKRYAFAIYSSLGLKKTDLYNIFIKHTFLLSLMGTALGIGVAILVIPVLNEILQSVLPFKLPFVISAQALVIGVFVGLLGVFLLAYPLVHASIAAKPASLFQEVNDSIGRVRSEKVMAFIPYILFFTAMSFYCAHSFRVGGIFLLIFMVSIFLAIGVALLLMRFFNRVFINSRHDFRWNLSWKYLSRHKISTLSIFLSLLLGSMLLNLIPMLQQSIHQELSLGSNRSSKRPSLFLFDIQDEQVASLETYFKKRQEPLLSMSPLIRARISKVNAVVLKVDESKTLTREQERKKRFRNRGTNLSFRAKLTSSEKVVEGEWFPDKPYNQDIQAYPYISIEQRYAERLGISLGDLVEFTIMGIPITGKILNLRKVKWTSFLPNFFIQFQPGVLEDAPKTWLAAVGQLSDAKKIKIQKDLFDKFPNVSAVDLSQVVTKILSVMDKMGLALQAMSFICVIVGLFVQYCLVHHQVNSRLKDFALLKVIGLNEKALRSMALREFTMIGLISSFLGASFSIVMANIVSLVFFDGNFVLKIYIPLASIGVITLLCLLTTNLAIGKVQKKQVNHFL